MTDLNRCVECGSDRCFQQECQAAPPRGPAPCGHVFSAAFVTCPTCELLRWAADACVCLPDDPDHCDCDCHHRALAAPSGPQAAAGEGDALARVLTRAWYAAAGGCPPADEDDWQCPWCGEFTPDSERERHTCGPAAPPAGVPADRARDEAHQYRDMYRTTVADRISEQEAVHADLSAILRSLGLGDHARPYSSHEVVQREVLPALADRARDEDEGRLRARIEALCDRADRITSQSGPTAMVSVVKTAELRAALAGPA